MPIGSVECRICHNALEIDAIADMATSSIFYKCKHCGPYRLTEEVDHDLSAYMSSYGANVQFIPHAIYRMRSGGPNGPLINSEQIEKLFHTPYRPTPYEQADNLIKLIGEKFIDIGSWVGLNHLEYGAQIGATNDETFGYIVRLLMRDNKVHVTTNTEHLGYGIPIKLELTFNGWNRYEKLKLGSHSGNTAFMAMQFGDPVLELVVNDCFRPAVDSVGFSLRKLDDPEHQRAGLIDDRLRNEIKSSRFILSDLTHANNGAYWEAGYAEGLGKPVIYTCEQGVFKNRVNEGGGTHFDTNHHLHILWDAENLQDAEQRLMACIRATIPEAKQ